MVIGITGYKGSGKSVIASYLVREYRFRSLNFKAGLIKELRENFGPLLEEIRKQSDCASIPALLREKPTLARLLLQCYGTEVRRGDDPDYWVNKWQKSLARMSTNNIVADDVRFLNEEAAVKLQGGIIIRIVRDDIKPKDKHTSETEQKSIEPDFTIVAGKGEHEKVYKAVDEIIRTLKENVD